MMALDLNRRNWIPRIGNGLAGASLAVLALSMVSPAQAQEATPTEIEPPVSPSTPEGGVDEGTPTGGDEEVIVVTGFRASLESAIGLKRDSVSSVDAIVAEDIADFPDQNLAESLQRIPGITITRDGGEGRNISVRGLGAQFTRVRLNGMETIVTSAGEGGPNRGRDFDFNVFASELFSSLVVHKTAEASLDEGSLGAVIDLTTGQPLNYDEGLTFVTSAQAQYNDLSEDVGPRIAGLLSYNSPSGTWGALVSAAYSEYKTLELGNNTVRWQQARFNSVEGVPCFTEDGSGGDYVSSPGCDAVATAFHPRIPRYGQISHDRERLGLTASFQWEPTERTSLSIDGLYAALDQTRGEKWGEVLFRGNERGIDVVDYTINSDLNIVETATIDNAWVRTEVFEREAATDFHQLSATLDQEFSDTFRVKALGGFSKSVAEVMSESTIIFDDRDATGYQYDYTNMDLPRLTFGTSVEDPTIFQLAEFRDRPSEVTNKYRTGSLAAEWDVNDDFMIQFGGFFRQFDFDTTEATRDSTVCAAELIECSDTVYGLPVTADIAELFTLGDVGGAPDGTTLSYIVPDLGASAELLDLYNRPLNPSSSNIRSVTEKDYGGYLEFNVESEIFGMRYGANAGIRYVRTDQSSTGINNAQTVTVERSYEDWLPAANLALFPTDSVIVRFAVADVMARPGLGSLTPGGSVDGFNYRVSFGNPQLDPFRATAYDAAIEWYFAPTAVASVAVFAKDIESFPVSDTRTGTYASTGLPLSLILASSPAAQNPEAQPWTINTTLNGEGGKLKGIELALQSPFSFLPAPFDNFGGIVNYTYVDSDVDYTVRGGATSATDPNYPNGPQATVSERLFGLSNESINGTLYYEDDRFSIRGSLAYRSGYLDGTSATGNIFEGYNSILTVDMSARYSVTEYLDITFEAVNLTDEFQDRFVDLATDRNYEYDHTGRVFLLGARLTL